MTNAELSHTVIKELLKAGVREFCLCAGARNSPLIHFFDQNPHLKAYHFFEERSAGFFALGRIALTRRPVAVITTSGTAAAELLPATIEGTYSSLPLILITADRPKTYRGSGAPQTIEQVGLFSYYIEACFDLDEVNSHISLKGLSWKKAIHINLCFKEPLLDEEPKAIEIPRMDERTRFPEALPWQMVDDIQNFLRQHRPLVILSTLPEKSRDSVLQFLKKLQAPIYAEGISGFRGHPDLEKLTLLSGEKMVARLLDQKICDSILRIGGVPTLRLWRDLEDVRRETPVLSIGYNHFTGLSREVLHFSDLEDLVRMDVESYSPLKAEMWEEDRKKLKELHSLFEKYPRSEPAMVHFLSRHFSRSSVYLGNSLPVREWDLAADARHRPLRVVGNRGSNGIDGQVSTFLGWAREKEENWCLIGDLTAMYDLSALWITPQLSESQLRLVVINNKGGMIFKRIFQKEIYLNRHEINFKSWAEMWKWDYVCWSEVPAQFNLGHRQIIELTPSEEQTDLFWQDWEKIWQS